MEHELVALALDPHALGDDLGVGRQAVAIQERPRYAERVRSDRNAFCGCLRFRVYSLTGRAVVLQPSLGRRARLLAQRRGGWPRNGGIDLIHSARCPQRLNHALSVGTTRVSWCARPMHAAGVTHVTYSA